MSIPKRTRRVTVLKRLEAQLKTGTKNTKEGQVPLSDKDINRIEKEIRILTSRV